MVAHRSTAFSHLPHTDTDVTWTAGRCLIVNADDFGRTSGINRGVIRAFEEGIVTSASLMVRWPAAEQAADYARSHPELGLGLHFDVLEWTFRDGEWFKIYEVASTEDACAIEAEFERQILAFRRLIGKDPSHIDSHQDVHRRVPWVNVLLKHAEELGIPVRHYSPRIACCGEFYGQDSRGTSWPEYISPEALRRIFAGLPSGITELVCHPGESDDDDAYGAAHWREVESLCDASVREAAFDAGIRLCSFAQVPYRFKSSTRVYNRVVSLWKRGHKVAAADLLRKELIDMTPTAAQTAAQVYLDVDDPVEAWRLVEPLSDQFLRQELLIRIARSLRSAGHLAAACCAIERACGRDPRDTKAISVREAIVGESEVLRGNWRPPVLKVGRMRPVPGRVLHVVGKSLPHSQVGYTVRTHYVAKAQRAAGLDPCVVTQYGFPWYHGVSEASVCDEIDGIAYYRLAALTAFSASLSERLSRHAAQLAPLVQRLRPAVLHAASDFLNPLVALAVGRTFGLPVVYEVRGFWEETWLSKRNPEASARDAYQWRREREFECMLQADHVVTLADLMKSQLVDRGLPADRITVIPNAVDTSLFTPVQRDEALRTSLSLASDDVVLGYISSFSSYEGITFLIDAIDLLLREGLPVKGLLVGDGEESGRLRRQVETLGITDQVLFTGRVPHSEVLRYYSLIDVFVVPRTADRVSQLVTPLKPYEAMATGRAVVLSDVPALREMVQEGVTGLTFKPESAESLARVLRRLVQNPRERARLGEAAQAWVGQHRTWSCSGRLYQDLFRSLGVA